MKTTSRQFALTAALAIAVMPARAWASLGGDASSIGADQARVKGALMRVVTGSGYTVHEMQSATGVTIREYVSGSGPVFAVTWQGSYLPDLSQILGAYYVRFQQQAERIQRSRKSRGTLLVEDPDFVVQMSGHQRAFGGRAYLPRSMPQGLNLQAIR
jgi:hypothetical protein